MKLIIHVICIPMNKPQEKLIVFITTFVRFVFNFMIYFFADYKPQNELFFFMTPCIFLLACYIALGWTSTLAAAEW